MRALFITGGSIGTVFPNVPLAWAARQAGHEVIMAGPDVVVPTIAKTGLPPVSISPEKKQQLSRDLPDDPIEQMRHVGRWYGWMAAETFDPLLRLAENWRPDVVIGGPMFHSATLLGHRCGVPTVRQPWGVFDAREYAVAANEELRPLLDELGLDAAPSPDLLIDMAPPSLRGPDAPPAQPLRWIPGNQHRSLEPWMYTRGSRPRVLLTSGSRVTSEGTLHTLKVEELREIASHFAALNLETVIAVPDEVAPKLRGDGEEPRAGWIPLDVIAPTCDLIVHHGGAGSNMTALSNGVPQLILREIPSSGEVQPQVDFGAVIDLPKEEQTVDNIVAACRTLLSDPGYAERARTLAREIAEMPTPVEVVGALERLAAEGSSGGQR